MRKKTWTHKCTKTTIDLENNELVVILVAVRCGERLADPCLPQDDSQTKSREIPKMIILAFFGLIIVHTYNYCSWNLQWKLCPDNANYCSWNLQWILCPDNALSRLAKILYPPKSLASSYTRNVLIAAPRISWPLQKHAKKAKTRQRRRWVSKTASPNQASGPGPK